MKARQKWTLEEIFKGGSSSSELQKELKSIEKDIAAFGKIKGKERERLIDTWQELYMRERQVEAFAHCLTAQNVDDEKAREILARVTTLTATFQKATDDFIQKLSEMKDTEFQKLIAKPQYKDIAYQLSKKRAMQREKQAPHFEHLATDLAIDGYHGWHSLYSLLSGKMQIPYDGKLISAAQADNLLSHPDRKVRKKVFDCWNKVCQAQEYVFEETLNHLAGFRLELYKHRSWSSILKEPLFHNSIQEESVRLMWSVISANKKPFVQFLQKKAHLLKIPKQRLGWQDLDAPLGDIKKKFTYQAASKLIIESFAQFSPHMAEFAKSSLEKGWVEAENRVNKAPGGFCINFPVSNQTRIYMTYSDTFQNLLTLAHELGHAYHSHVMFALPALSQEYPMTLAETASTLAEGLVLEGMLKSASREEKKIILHNRAQRSVDFLMDIHARFIFEEAFYKERKEGVVSSKRISQLMEDAQNSAFDGALKELHPYFWITKQHFYFSHLPFYNFPYTVGYLISLQLMRCARDKKADFANWYVQFLQDTGKMSVEDIIKKHFRADLKKFWQEAIDVATSDVKEFLSLC